MSHDAEEAEIATLRSIPLSIHLPLIQSALPSASTNASARLRHLLSLPQRRTVIQDGVTHFLVVAAPTGRDGHRDVRRVQDSLGMSLQRALSNVTPQAQILAVEWADLQSVPKEDRSPAEEKVQAEIESSVIEHNKRVLLGGFIATSASVVEDHQRHITAMLPPPMMYVVERSSTTTGIHYPSSTTSTIHHPSSADDVDDGWLWPGCDSVLVFEFFLITTVKPQFLNTELCLLCVFHIPPLHDGGTFAPSAGNDRSVKATSLMSREIHKSLCPDSYGRKHPIDRLAWRKIKVIAPFQISSWSSFVGSQILVSATLRHVGTSAGDQGTHAKKALSSHHRALSLPVHLAQSTPQSTSQSHSDTPSKPLAPSNWSPLPAAIVSHSLAATPTTPPSTPQSTPQSTLPEIETNRAIQKSAEESKEVSLVMLDDILFDLQRSQWMTTDGLSEAASGDQTQQAVGRCFYLVDPRPGDKKVPILLRSGESYSQVFSISCLSQASVVLRQVQPVSILTTLYVTWHLPLPSSIIHHPSSTPSMSLTTYQTAMVIKWSPPSIADLVLSVSVSRPLKQHDPPGPALNCLRCDIVTGDMFVVTCCISNVTSSAMDLVLIVKDQSSEGPFALSSEGPLALSLPSSWVFDLHQALREGDDKDRTFTEDVVALQKIMYVGVVESQESKTIRVSYLALRCGLSPLRLVLVDLLSGLAHHSHLPAHPHVYVDQRL